MIVGWKDGLRIGGKYEVMMDFTSGKTQSSEMIINIISLQIQEHSFYI